MIKNKNLALFLILLIMLVSTISFVSAEDISAEDIQTSYDLGIDASNENIPISEASDIQANDAGEILSQENEKTFTDLNSLINDNSNDEVFLEDNYTYNPDSDEDYKYGISINRSLTVDGKGHTINGISMAKGFNVSAYNVVFKNINFINMGTLNDGISDNGGAIYVKMGPIEDTAVLNSSFTNCCGNYGGAIYNANPQDCNFTDCQANDFGGALYYGTAVNCNFKNNKVSGNDGGAIYWGVAKNCSFYQNQAKYGGAVYNVNAVDCVFAENNATSGGALYSIRLNVTNCTFISNRASLDGGAVYSESHVINSNFINNSAERNGGALYLDNGYAVLCIFENNSALGDGGAVCNGNIVQSKFTNNAAEGNGSDYSGSQITNISILPDEFSVEYPASVVMPISVVYDNYTLDGINVSIELRKNQKSIANYSCLSGSFWTADLDAGIYGIKYTIDSLDVESYCMLTVNGVKTHFDVEDMEVFLKEDKYLVATLLTEDSIPVAGYSVTVMRYGFEENLTTDENGQIKIALKDLSSNFYYFTFSFEGKGLFENSVGYANVFIRPMNVAIISDSLFDVVYNQVVYINATLLTETDVPMVGYNLSIIIEGHTTVLETDENGQVTMKLPVLPVGVYTFRIKFDSNDEAIISSFRDFYLFIEEGSSQIVAEDNIIVFYGDDKISAQIIDSYGNPLSGLDLSLSVGDLNLESASDENGEVEFDVSELDIGNYSATVSFDGNDNCRASSKSFNVNVVDFRGTFTDLQRQIDNAEDGILDLPYDFAYSEELDGESFVGGVYVENPLEIYGNDHIISGNNLSRIFIFDLYGEEVSMEDLTLIDGIADYGGAIYIYEDSTVYMDNVKFNNNLAESCGGAIYSEGILYIENSLFDGNGISLPVSASEDGGAAIYNYGEYLSIVNTNITNHLKGIDRLVEDPNNYLAAAVVTYGETIVKDSYFANNSGSLGGAISAIGYFDDGLVLTLNNTSFEGNEASFGGAIYAKVFSLEIENCSFNSNQAKGIGTLGQIIQGGAIVICPNSDAYAIITDSVFTNNFASQRGGAICLQNIGGDSLIENCTFESNTATEGGALYLLSSFPAVVTVSDSSFNGNVASGLDEYEVSLGNAILNDGVMELHNNSINKTYAEIYNGQGDIDSNLKIIIFNNQTITANLGDKLLLWAVFYDDNENIVFDPYFRFLINNKTTEGVGFDGMEYFYEYLIDSPGEKVISSILDFDYDYGEIERYISIINVPKVNISSFVISIDPEEDVKQGENLTVNIKLEGFEGAGLNTSVKLYFNDSLYYANVFNGTGLLNISTLAPGDYSAIGVFEENDFYNEAYSNVVDLTILFRGASDIQELIDNANPGDTIILGNYSYMNVSDINITKDLTILASENTTITSANDGNPIFNIPSPLNDGPNNLTVSGINFVLGNGDVVFVADADNSTNLNIDTAAININNNSFGLASNEIVPESIIIFKLNSELGVLSPTNEIAIKDNVIAAGIDPFEFEVSSINSGSDVNILPQNFTVERKATVIEYSDMNTTAVSPLDSRTGEWFIWRLVDGDGNPIANTPMKIGFNGVIYDEKNGMVTDENGFAKLQINLGYKGDYTFAISFLGNDNYNASFVVAKIKVATQTGSLTVPNKSYAASAKTKSLTATFKTKSGKAVANKKISFTVNGKTYSAKTNDKGIATVNVSLNKKGTYSFTAKFAGDSTYSEMTKTAKLVIK